MTDGCPLHHNISFNCPAGFPCYDMKTDICSSQSPCYDNYINGCFYGGIFIWLIIVIITIMIALLIRCNYKLFLIGQDKEMIVNDSSLG